VREAHWEKQDFDDVRQSPFSGVKKRVLSAGGRAAIAKAAKKPSVRVRKQTKKVSWLEF
jgi:hypothetical protein